jgi:hypothetical protein
VEQANAEGVDPPLPPFPSLWRTPVDRSSVPWHLLASAVVIGLGLKLVGPAWLQILESASIHTLKEVGVLLLALNAAILFHEAGHLAVALALDFDVLGGSFGPVRLIRVHGTWSLQFSWNLFSGSVIVIPRHSDTSWRVRMLAMVAGGPVATLLAALGAAILLVVLGTSDGWIVRFLAASLELNFFLFVLGLLPNAPQSRLPNDARLLTSLLRSTPEANEILLYHLVVQLQLAGVRPRDYPEHIIRKLARARGRPDMCFVHANAITLWAIDRGDVSSADRWEERALDLSDFCNVKVQNSALAASAFFDLIFRNNPRSARSKLTEVHISTLSPAWFRYRIAAAFSLTAGKIEAALAEIARARYSFPNRLPYYDFERMLLSRLHTMAIATEPEELTARV